VKSGSAVRRRFYWSTVIPANSDKAYHGARSESSGAMALSASMFTAMMNSLLK